MTQPLSNMVLMASHSSVREMREDSSFRSPISSIRARSAGVMVLIRASPKPRFWSWSAVRGMEMLMLPGSSS